MVNDERINPRWLDFLWLLFLLVLALLPPVREWHKQLILVMIGAFQLLEERFVRVIPLHGQSLALVIKLALATLLLVHTSDVPINSSYYPIYYLPIMTAAMYFGPLGTLFWTLLASAAYYYYLYSAQKSYEVVGLSDLWLRIAFFFLLGMIVNRFVMESRLQRIWRRPIAA